MNRTVTGNTPATGLHMRKLVMALAAAFGTAPALAATLTVGAGGDATNSTGCGSPVNNTCTLRGALSSAGNGDTIVFRSSLSNQTITFTSDDPAISGFPGPTALLISGKSVTMDASALAQPVTLSGNNARRVFYVAASGGLTLKSINLANGQAQGYAGGTSASGGGGGGAASLGGAILSQGALTVENASLSLNQVTGGNGGNGGVDTPGIGGGGGGTAEAGSQGTAGSGGGGLAGSGSNGGAGGFGGGGGGSENTTSNVYNGGSGGFGGGGGGAGRGEGTTYGGSNGWSAGAGAGSNGIGGGGGGGGSGLGGALLVMAGSVTLKNNTFSSNTAQFGSGGSTYGGGTAEGGSGYGGAVFVCTSTEDGSCSGSLDEAASCGNNFNSNTVSSGQADLFWTGASGGAHDTSGVTDVCPAPVQTVAAPVPAIDNWKLFALSGLLAAAGLRARRRRS